MNRVVRFLVIVGLIGTSVFQAQAQKKIDEERMLRDIEVTENILSTVIKQQLDKRSFFPMEVSGEYREGLGVMFRLPYEINGPIAWAIDDALNGNFKVLDGRDFNYQFNFNTDDEEALDRANEELLRANEKAVIAQTKSGRITRRFNSDSMRTATSEKIIEACKTFLADYGDLITQLPANEKIIITNRGEGERIWYGAFVGRMNPSYISVEAVKSDINEFRQGKINRDAFYKRIKVVNSVLDDELQPDLELITSIFNRLYRPDLSKTFFTEEDLYYERMKDFGVIYYMQVFSSNANSGFYRREDVRYSMPTINENGLSQSERDKKVLELYPKFEKNIKEDILEYGRTIKSLKPEESLIFNIKMTKCEGCGIPASLEVSIKADVLNNYASGKFSKEAALAKMIVKKGSIQ